MAQYNVQCKLGFTVVKNGTVEAANETNAMEIVKSTLNPVLASIGTLVINITPVNT